MIDYEKNKELLLTKLEKGKESIESYDGSMLPLVYPTVEGDDERLYTLGTPLMLYYKDEEEFKKICKSSGGYCNKKDADGVILVMSSKTRKMEKISQEELDYFLENYETERPSMYPDSMVQQNLTVIYMDFISDSVLSLVSEYKKVDGKFVFSEPYLLDNVVLVVPSLELIKDGYLENYQDPSIKFDDDFSNVDDDDEEDDDEYTEGIEPRDDPDINLW